LVYKEGEINGFGNTGIVAFNFIRKKLSEKKIVKSYILKQQWCLSVWAVPRRFFQSLPIPCGAGDKQGKVGWPGQLLQGAARGAISVKKILGENQGTYI
jgi:hypothetical protein